MVVVGLGGQGVAAGCHAAPAVAVGGHGGHPQQGGAIVEFDLTHRSVTVGSRGRQGNGGRSSVDGAGDRRGQGNRGGEIGRGRDRHDGSQGAGHGVEVVVGLGGQGVAAGCHAAPVVAVGGHGGRPQQGGAVVEFDLAHRSVTVGSRGRQGNGGRSGVDGAGDRRGQGNRGGDVHNNGRRVRLDLCQTAVAVRRGRNLDTDPIGGHRREGNRPPDQIIRRDTPVGHRDPAGSRGGTGKSRRILAILDGECGHTIFGERRGHGRD